MEALRTRTHDVPKPCRLASACIGAAILVLAVKASANPAAPELGGRWDSTATAGAGYTVQSGTIAVDPGVVLTVAPPGVATDRILR